MLILSLLLLLAYVSLVRKGASRTPGENRAVYLSICTGFVVLAGLGVTWAGALFAVLLLNILRDPSPSARMGLSWYPTIPLAMLYVWVPARLPEDATVWIGGGIVALGCLTCVWAWVSFIRWNGQPYAWWWVTWPWKIGFWELGGDLSAGQLNVNHTQAVAVVACGAAMGLTLTHSGWWFLALPLCASTIQLVDWRDRQLPDQRFRSITQGVIHAGHLVYFGVIPWLLGWWLLYWMVPLYLVAALPLVSHAVRYGTAARFDSGRCRMWAIMLVGGWWQQGWKVRLFGQGWGSWWQGHDTASKIRSRSLIPGDIPFWSCAHNDYVQMLLEHGAVGFVCLLGFLGERLYLTGLHDPTVYLMGIAMCSVMLLSFPVTLYHETYVPRDEGVMTLGVGSPTLNVLALLIALLAGRL